MPVYQWYDGHKATGLAAVRSSPPVTEKSLCLLGPLAANQRDEGAPQASLYRPFRLTPSCKYANQPNHFGNLKEVFLRDSRKISIFVKGIPDAHLWEDISRL